MDVDLEKQNAAHEKETTSVTDDKVEADHERQHAIAYAEPTPAPRTNVEMRRELTKHEEHLTQALYHHISEEPAGGKKKEEKQVDIDEHRLTLDGLAQKFNTTFDSAKPGASKGLTAKDAEERLARDGRNVLTPPKRKSAFRKFLDCLSSLFNILLILAGVLEYILLGIDFENNKANEYLGAILIGVAFLNAFIEFYQLQKSAAILASFLAMIPPSCHVVRDGQLLSVPAETLVKGDVVLIRMGDKTPADLCVIAATDLKVDNSSLTGEAEPQERKAVVSGPTVRAVEAENLVFNSTSIVSGEAWGVVVRTGDHTFIGQIAKLTAGESDNKSPLSVEIDHFVLIISCIAIATAIIFFCVGITSVYQGKAAATVTFAVSVLVAWVPEGLPSTVTLLLTIAAKRMAKENVLVKDLQGVETLGALTLIATDKTGTLTRNQMTVTNLWSSEQMYTAFKSNNDEDTTREFTIKAPGMREMVDIATLNSKIKFDKTDVPFADRKILGDATETGLARFAVRAIMEQGQEYDAYVAGHPKVFEIPFNSVNKWALCVVQNEHASGSLAAYIKGAPERVLDKCTHYLMNGEALPITDEFRGLYDGAYSYMASRGHRVIACAQSLLPKGQYPANIDISKANNNVPLDGFCFVGLFSLEDPPKHGVREAIGTLRMAGIKVMMVTGDHPKTAEAIARKINLMIGETKEKLSERTGRPIDEIDDIEVEAVVIHGDQIDNLSPHEWDLILSKNEVVFARTSPKHKLEIVKHAQALGHIVGVTGDGVNDSPALRAADLGIAMHLSGSDVSKEAANMILLDDNFASVVKGVQQGRLIFANLKRSIQYTVTHSIPEVIPQLLYVVVPIPLPLSAILILVIDLGFELIAALSFAWDPPETAEGLMRLKPRKPVTDRSILSRKKKAFRRTKTIVRDPETGEVRGPTLASRIFSKIRHPFTRHFWEDAFEKTDEEVLVDNKLLSYGYLEAGMIEMLACLVSYFVVFYQAGLSPYDLKIMQQAGIYFSDSSPPYTGSRGWTLDGPAQSDAFGQAQSIVYLSIFIVQCFNMFAVKARIRFPFGKHVVSNPWNFGGILAGAALAMFIVYTPPLHVVFGCSYRLSPLYWLIPVGFGILLLGWASLRVVLMRRSLEEGTVRPIKGLMMFPTMRTMSLRQRTMSLRA
jgi:sodium/potassium-transporting ATPase subunit alpha